MAQKCQKLHIFSFGFALGILWAIAVFVSGMVAGSFDWGSEFIALIASVYIGFEPTFIGSVIGAVWGFVDAFIGGVLFAWLYNTFARCCESNNK